ncbi:MAG: hypothetical protein HY796_11135, partial [Elusimicrobia bacterium]|nr:hypothetical protein [Elusimicrobiota bacterium]
MYGSFAGSTTVRGGNGGGLAQAGAYGTIGAYYAVSAQTVDERPEVFVNASQAVSLAPVAVSTGVGSIILATANASGIYPVSNIYEVGPENVVFSPPLLLTFRYSTSTLAQFNIAESDIYLYHYEPDGSLARVPGQLRDTGRKEISVEIAMLTSIFAIFGQSTDKIAPVTTLGIVGPEYNIAEKTYISTRSSVALSAYDPVVYATSTGVAFMEFRIDADTSAPFTLYASPFSLPEGFHAIEFRSQDNAGNLEAAKSSYIYVDGTAPIINISSPAAGETFVATRNKITVGFNVADNLDPAPAFGAFLAQIEDKGSPRGNRPSKIAVANGQAIEPLNIDDGIWRLTVSATDFADNAAYMAGGTFEVIHDVLAPRTELRVEGIGYRVEGTEYVTERTTFTLTSIDDLITSGDGIGLGVKKQAIRLKAEGLIVKELIFENAEPKQGEAFVSTFRVAGTADGIYGLAYNAGDIIGNIEEVKISTYAVDNTAPVTELTVSGVRFAVNGNTYISTKSSIAITAADPVINGAASGVKAVYYQVDNQALSIYISSFTLTEGIHRVAFYAVDNLNNAENLKTVTLLVDDTPPITSLVPGGNYYIPLSGQHVGDFYAPAWFAYKLSAYDPVVKDVSSSLAVSEYRIIALDHFNTEPVDPSPQDLGRPFTLFNYNIPNNSFALAEGIQRVDYRSRDNVLNLELV